MTDIPLEFAKQILGWPEARRDSRYNYGKIYRDETINLSLSVYDIRQIMRFVKWYCKKVGTRIDLNCLYDAKPAEALMRECLELKRMLEIGTS